MYILPIASGKGGVGKSLFAANTALALAQNGKKVILADLDLGGSNLHLILGIRHIKKGIGTFLSEAKSSIEDIILDTDHENLLFIPGDAEIPGMANLSVVQKKKLLGKLTGLKADYLICDLGAGTSLNILDFFLSSARGIIVSTPTPTALVNAYLFLKNAVFRIVTSAVQKNTAADQFLKQLNKDSNSLQKLYIQEVVKKIGELHEPSHRAIIKALQNFRPRLVMNMLEDPKDAEKANKLRRSCQQYLGIDLEHLGIMYRDDLQDTALHAGLPIVSYKPKAVLSQAIFRISDKIIQSELEEKEENLGIEVYNASFEEAEMEAEIDFGSKIEYLEELLQTGALSPGDLLETIKSQHIEIGHLRRENSLLKSKLVKAAQQGYSL